MTTAQQNREGVGKGLVKEGLDTRLTLKSANLEPFDDRGICDSRRSSAH